VGRREGNRSMSGRQRQGTRAKEKPLLYKGRSSPKGWERGIDPQLTFGERVDHGSLRAQRGGDQVVRWFKHTQRGVTSLFDTREKRGGFNEAWWYTTLQSGKYER
jgi:hypothetical protein